MAGEAVAQLVGTRTKAFGRQSDRKMQSAGNISSGEQMLTHTSICRKAIASDLEMAISCLTVAFDGDPVLNWMLRADSSREGAFQVFFRTLFELALPHGEILVANEGAGFALWYPPGKSRISLLKQIILLPRMVQAGGLRRLGRILKVLAAFEREHPKEENFYLSAIGTHPEQQRKGIGSRLLRPVLEHCDREGLGAYLENTSEENLVFYRRHGFTVREKIEVGKGAPVIYGMWRSPGSDGSQGEYPESRTNMGIASPKAIRNDGSTVPDG